LEKSPVLAATPFCVAVPFVNLRDDVRSTVVEEDVPPLAGWAEGPELPDEQAVNIATPAARSTAGIATRIRIIERSPGNFLPASGSCEPLTTPTVDAAGWFTPRPVDP